MPFYETCYDTTVGRIHSHSKLELALKETLIANYSNENTLGVQSVENYQAAFITGLQTEEATVPNFIHPYLIKNFKGKNYLCTDVRAFRPSMVNEYSEFEKNVKNRSEYYLNKTRTAMTLMWVAGNIKQIRSKYNFAGSVYAAWVSQAVARAYALDFSDQARITALATYFYYSLFCKTEQDCEDALELAVIHSIKTTKLPAKELYSIFETAGQMNNISEFCERVYAVTENLRLKDFNLTMLLTLIRNSWYGLNAKEIISAALEHPPTWIAVVFATLSERTYKSSTLYKVAEAAARRSNAAEFKSHFLEAMDDTIVTESFSFTMD